METHRFQFLWWLANDARERGHREEAIRLLGLALSEVGLSFKDVSALNCKKATFARRRRKSISPKPRIHRSHQL